ncbi:hypothetical protein TpMuguga_04g00023 [Theileria parva strain Muguga]|uniref:Uncharacterized protein n=1 Tax=Theileria parva TaxID=5875 RepID=Q4N3K4_THEPA|nr:uncharacterized protein TpMuguga_04g00023 [Theileria parva strain Muguga]EAN31375.1 hypothetical protein TpMuguga_04g00023 [Theileria parva strain Muguga]|eukprot:XP_763658.1 hypothetical protein [Theileria parva strain Muguga]
MRINGMYKYLTVYTIFCFCWKSVDSTHTNGVLTQPKNQHDLNQVENQQFSKAADLDQSDSQLYASYVNIYTIDEDSNELVENDTDRYYVDEYKSTFYFRFYHDSKCVELNYLGKQVWKHDNTEYGDEYPKEIFFQRVTKRIIINYPTLYLSYSYRNHNWKFESKVDLKIVFENGLTIITSDNKNLSNPKVNDTSNFKVKLHDYVYQYVIEDNVKCVEVKLGEKNVWKYKTEEYKRGFPTSLYFHRDLGLIFMDFNDMSSMFRCNETTCKCIGNNPMKGISVSDLKIHTIDPYNYSKINENDETQYERKDTGYGYIFNLNEKAKMRELLYKDKVLWYYGYKSKQEYPKSVFLNTYLKMIAVKFSNYHLVYMYLHKWRYICKSSSMTLSESDVKIYTKIGPEVKENDQESYELVKYPYGYALSYNIKTNANLVQLKFKNKTVWKHNPRKLGQNYPNNIYINRDMKMIILTSPKFIYVYVNLDKWRKVFESVDKDILQTSTEYSTDSSSSSSGTSDSETSDEDISETEQSSDSKPTTSQRFPAGYSTDSTPSSSDIGDSESSDEETYQVEPPRKKRYTRGKPRQVAVSRRESDTSVTEPTSNETKENKDEVLVKTERLERGHTKEYVLGIVIAVVLLILGAGLGFALYHTRKIKKSRNASSFSSEIDEITVF